MAQGAKRSSSSSVSKDEHADTVLASSEIAPSPQAETVTEPGLGQKRSKAGPGVGNAAASTSAPAIALEHASNLEEKHTMKRVPAPFRAMICSFDKGGGGGHVPKHKKS